MSALHHKILLDDVAEAIVQQEPELRSLVLELRGSGFDEESRRVERLTDILVFPGRHVMDRVREVIPELRSVAERLREADDKRWKRLRVVCRTVSARADRTLLETQEIDVEKKP